MNISIIIPAYNREKMIENCILSVKNQLGENNEIIIVDDGSNDKTVEICKKLCTDNIRLIRQNHVGVSAARNNGIKNAQGEYVTFIDSDDYVGDGYIKTLETAAESKPELVVFNSFEKQNPDGKFVKFNCGLEKSGECSITKIYPAAICQRLNTVWHKLFRRDIIIKNQVKFNSDMIIAEDFMFVTDYIGRCKSCLIMPYIPYYFCFNISGTYKTKPEHLQNLMTAYENTLLFIKDNCPDIDKEPMQGRFLQQTVETAVKLYCGGALAEGLETELKNSKLCADLTSRDYGKPKSKIEKQILSKRKWKLGAAYLHTVRKFENIKNRSKNTNGR